MVAGVQGAAGGNLLLCFRWTGNGFRARVHASHYREERRVTPNARPAQNSPHDAQDSTTSPEAPRCSEERKNSRESCTHTQDTHTLSTRSSVITQHHGRFATRWVAALHRPTAAGGAVMEANVGVRTATLGGLDKDQAAGGDTMEVNGHMTWTVNTDAN